MKSIVWKSIEGRERLETWYSRFQKKIDANVQSLIVPTSFGESHVLQSGPDDAPPLVCLHAMRTGASFLLSELGPVLKRFRVIAPDLPAQSVRGIDVRLSLKDDSHAKWLVEVFNHLGLDQVPLFGVSWGGFVARLTASHAADRITKLGLLVPAGIANGSHFTGLAKMLFPMIRYRLWSNTKNLKKLLAPILTTWDEDWANSIACSLRDMKFDPRIPPLATEEALRKLEMPTLVLAAEHDISFPGKAVAERVKKHVPNIETEIIPGCRHCPPTTDDFREWLGARLITFFGE